MEEGFTGARQAGRPLLLEGGLDWKALSLSPKDMDFLEAKNAAAREIALALGVPPMLLGIPGDNTFSNYQEAQRAFWRQTVLPLFNRTMQALSNWLAPAWDDRLQLRGDLDQIEALTIEREALWARLQATSFLTDDEKRAAIGYASLPVEPVEPEAFEDDEGPGKYNPYHDELGRFTTSDDNVGGATENGGSDQTEAAAVKPNVVLAASRKGGLAKEVMKYSVRKFVSSFCKGEINRELPSEFDDYTIEDVLDIAKGGDARAKKCRKRLKNLGSERRVKNEARWPEGTARFPIPTACARNSIFSGASGSGVAHGLI